MPDAYRLGQTVRWIGLAHDTLYEGTIQKVAHDPDRPGLTVLMVKEKGSSVVWPLCPDSAVVEVIPWRP